MKIVLELETADPESLLSSDAPAAFKAMMRAGIKVTRVDPAGGPPIVGRLRSPIQPSRGQPPLSFDAWMEHRRAGREP